MMFTIKHQLDGWELFRDGEVWSCVFYELFEDAVDVLRIWFPAAAELMLASLKCEACSSRKGVEPEQIGNGNFLLTCKACRSCGPLVHKADDNLAKKCKKAHVVREITPFAFAALARQDARRLGLKSTGSPTLDRTLRMPGMPGVQPPMSKIIEAEDAPKNCQLCDCDITDSFVDGVLMGTGGSWGNFCVPCHREHGIGYGPGKGQRYHRQADGTFHQVEGGRKSNG